MSPAKVSAIVKTICVTTFALTLAFTLVCLWFGQSQRSAAEGQPAGNTQQETTTQEAGGIPPLNAEQSARTGQENQSNASKWSDPMVLLTLALVISVSITNAIYWGQLRKMRQTVGLVATQGEMMQGQLGAMEKQESVMSDSLAETRKIVDQNERAVKAAEENVKLAKEARKDARTAAALDRHMHELEMVNRAGAMGEQIQTMKDSLAEARAMVAQNERIAKAVEAQARASQASAQAAELSAKAAERSIELTQQAYISSERAYVGIREITMDRLKDGEIPTLHVTWYNGGKTPANRFRAVPYLVFGDKPEWKGYFIDDDWSDSRGNFLPTGIPQTMDYHQAGTGFKLVTREMIDELRGGGKRLYAMVKAHYVDFTEQRRDFKASYIYDPYGEFFTEL